MNPINFTLESDSKTKLYHQLYEKIATSIKNGSYPKDSKLPSIRIIATKLNVSKNTVTKAYELLEKNQFIYSEQKRGYFVKGQTSSIPEDESENADESSSLDDGIPTVESILRQRLKNQEPETESSETPNVMPLPKKDTESVTKDKQTKSVTNTMDTVSIPKSTDTVSVPQISTDTDTDSKPETTDDFPKQSDEEIKPLSLEEKLLECYKTVLLANQNSLGIQTETFGQLSLKKAVTKFLYSYLNINCDENQIVVGASKDSLLSSIIMLQSLNTPYIKSKGVGLLRLANQFTTGSLTTVKAITAVAEDTDLPTKKIFSAAGLPVKEVPTNEFGLNSDFLITSGATSVFTIPGESPEFSIDDPKDYCKSILEWANQTSYRYIIEYDTENFPNQNSLPRFKSLDSQDKVIYINSFENLLPLGLKTSFAILPKNILADFQQKYDNFSCPVSLLEQLVLTEFIEREFLTKD